MPCDLSIILPLRDLEVHVAATVRCAVRIAEAAAASQPSRDDAAQGSFTYEILALDERSGDNTLSVLSILHGQISMLRTLQDLEPGTAIARASRVARGDVWLVLDHPISPELACWALEELRSGKRAALVPGELLVTDRATGQAALERRRGGLITAQDAISRHLRRQGDAPATIQAPDRSTRRKAGLFVRRGLARLGLHRFDRP